MFHINKYVKYKYIVFSSQCMCCVQNPPSDGDSSINQPTDFHWAIPKISTAEKYFISQLITSPSKDVCIWLINFTPRQICCYLINCGQMFVNQNLSDFFLQTFPYQCVQCKQLRWFSDICVPTAAQCQCHCPVYVQQFFWVHIYFTCT